MEDNQTVYRGHASLGEEMTKPTQTKQAGVRRRLTTIIGKLDPHQAIPNERDLSQRLGVSRMTLRNALRHLIDQGLIYSVHGVGTFVAEPRMSKEVLFSSFTDDMRRRGLTPSSRILVQRVLPATELVAAALAMDPGELVYNVERVRLADNEPICLESAFFPAAELPNLLEHDLSLSLYALLRDHYRRPVVRAVTSVTARTLTTRQAEQLGDRNRAPALGFERTGFDQRGVPLEYCQATYRSGRIDLRYTVDVANLESPSR